MFASHFGHLESLKLLLSHLPNLSFTSTLLGHTALHLACISLHIPVALYLIYAGANTMIQDSENKTSMDYLYLDSNKNAFIYAVSEVLSWNRRRDFMLFVANLISSSSHHSFNHTANVKPPQKRKRRKQSKSNKSDNTATQKEEHYADSASESEVVQRKVLLRMDLAMKILSFI